MIKFIIPAVVIFLIVLFWEKINETIYKNISYTTGICPISEMIQKKLMVFKTNYRNLSLAKKQARILEKTINFFI